MTHDVNSPIVETGQGRVRGRVRQGTAIFRGIPYAAPPVGGLRFMPPQPPRGWTGILDAEGPGVMAPQATGNPRAQGSEVLEQSEDCLHLNVWSPSLNAERPRPVLVWFHGSGFRHGSGAWARYDGEKMARRGNVVVVTINHRIGVLGYMHAPSLFPSDFPRGNLSLLDQIAALRWVRDNISAFGGDPAAITVGGQSGGGVSTAALMAAPEAAGLFGRAIVQSAALRPPQSVEDAAKAASDFVHTLEVPVRTAQDLQRVGVDSIIRAQVKQLQACATFGEYYPPWQLVDDGDVFATPLVQAIARGWAGDSVDILTGATRDDGKAVMASQAGADAATFETLVGHLRYRLGAKAEEVVDLYHRMRPAESPGQLMGTISVDCDTRLPGLRIAAALSRNGRPAYVYEFDWQGNNHNIGACHGVEIPFIFDNFDAFGDAAMLSGADRTEVEAIAKNVQLCWTNFAATGDPNHGGIPHWRRFDPEARATMRLGANMDCIDDLWGTCHAALENALPNHWP